MKLYIGILLLAFSGSAFADAYLCIPEAAAGVSHNYKTYSDVTAKIYNTNDKYVLTNSSGKWVLKRHGEDKVYFSNCLSEYHCNNGEYYGGSFLRSAEGGIFFIVTMTGGENESVVAVSKGYCSKI
jgi:hypothetical protein